MIELKGVVKDYAWGGYCYIPMLLNKVPEGKTAAEYWLGEHPAGTATVVGGSKLNELIDSDPKQNLGEKVCKEYNNRLPYLLKVLDVREPLSIQVHPTLEQARAGYKREIEEKVEDKLRNYKDDNHKPELMLALSDFYLLHGFAKKEIALSNLGRFATTHDLVTKYDQEGLQKFVGYIFGLSKEALDKMLAPIVDSNKDAYLQDKISRRDPLFWLVRAGLRARECGQNLDAGLIMILIMNLMYVKEGDVVFQGAGIPHAYLEGQNIELMANSDNVIRGGLTPKLVDVKELLKIVKFEEITPKTITPSVNKFCGEEFNVPVKDFVLTKYVVKAGQSFVTPEDDGPSIWLNLLGEFKLKDGDKYFDRGTALYQKPHEVDTIVATNDVVIYKASAAL